MGKKNRKTGGVFFSFDGEPKPPPPEKDMDNRRPILDLISSLHLNSDYSDLVIICGGRTFPAHKLVVCPRSEYFRKACCGGFKETKEPIDLGDKNTVLVEKVLEFLYTGDYTYESHVPEGGDSQFDSNKAQGATTERTESTTVNNTSEYALDELTPETEDATNENVPPNPERTEPGVVAQTPLHKRPVSIDEALETVSSNQRGYMESIADSLTRRHPCYIHMRVFGEADYFMISDLKDRAKERFCETFRDCCDSKCFAEIIEELYSNRASYQSLRKLAIDVVVNNLPSLWKGFAPAINIELMRAVPDFAIDLCLATLDQHVAQHNPFSFGFEKERIF